MPFDLKSIGNQLKPFKNGIIVGGIFLLVLFVLKVVFPTINEMLANQTPITEIEATNNKEYKIDDQIKPEDFSIVATHENGRKSKISSSEIDISTKNIKPIGKTTTVTVVMKNDEAIKCEVKVKTSRKKIVSFTCGYPNIKDVKAVIYSNGELCFEGTGDIMTFDEGNMPWRDYEEKKEYPIRSVSFGKGVTPSNLNYFFEKLPELTYIDKIPGTVQSMVRTFADCPKITTTGDWSECSVLLNITECYEENDELLNIAALPVNVRTSARTFADCGKLMTPPDMSQAVNLVNCTEMFQDCKSLVSAVMAPNIVVAEGMYAGCINLKEVPVLPETLENMKSMFEGDVSLEKGNLIPQSVTQLSNCFKKCEFLSGEITINCNAQEFGGMFSAACLATKINLVGESIMLDAYANTKENNVNSIFVNSVQANQNIKSYEDVVRAEQERAAAQAAAESDENAESEDEEEPEEAHEEGSTPEEAKPGDGE